MGDTLQMLFVIVIHKKTPIIIVKTKELKASYRHNTGNIVTLMIVKSSVY